MIIVIEIGTKIIIIKEGTTERKKEIITIDERKMMTNQGTIEGVPGLVATTDKTNTLKSTNLVKGLNQRTHIRSLKKSMIDAKGRNNRIKRICLKKKGMSKRGRRKMPNTRLNKLYGKLIDPRNL